MAETERTGCQRNGTIAAQNLTGSRQVGEQPGPGLCELQSGNVSEVFWSLQEPGTYHQTFVRMCLKLWNYDLERLPPVVWQSRENPTFARTYPFPQSFMIHFLCYKESHAINSLTVNHDNQYIFIVLHLQLNYSQHKWSSFNGRLEPKLEWKFLDYNHHWLKTQVLVNLPSCLLGNCIAGAIFYKGHKFGSSEQADKKQMDFYLFIQSGGEGPSDLCVLCISIGGQ